MATVKDILSLYEDVEKHMKAIENSHYVDAKDILGVSYEELPSSYRFNSIHKKTLLDTVIKALADKGR